MPRGVRNGQRRNQGGNTESGSTETGDGNPAETGAETGELGDPGIEADAGLFIDPADLTGGKTGAEAGTQKRRGRKPGTKNATGKKKIATTLEGLESVLLSIHQMGAHIIKCPELELDPKEAASMSAAIARVAALYDIEASEATLAWINLAVVIGPIYAFRFFAVKARMAAEAEDAKRQGLKIVGGKQQ